MSGERTGQVALEYLVTYGWGFLVILIVIGALAYYGVLSPSQYFPARCEFGSQLVCEDWSFTRDEIKLTFRNNFGKAINITNAYVYDACGPSDLLNPPQPVTIRSGRTGRIVVDLCPNPPYLSGDKELASVTIAFSRNASGAPRHNMTGELFAKVRS